MALGTPDAPGQESGGQGSGEQTISPPNLALRMPPVRVGYNQTPSQPRLEEQKKKRRPSRLCFVEWKKKRHPSRRTRRLSQTHGGIEEIGHPGTA
jgi:hypothetical protein